MDIIGILRTITEHISFSIVVAVFAATGFVVLTPSVQESIGAGYSVIAHIVFVASMSWIFWEAIRWIFGIQQGRLKAVQLDRENLYIDIYQMQKRFGGLSGLLSKQEHHFEAAAEIADKYARLKQLGVDTPDIDIVAGEWDFSTHNQFLTALQPLLLKSPLKEVRTQARNLLGKWPSASI